MVTKLPTTALSGKVPVVAGINVGEDDLTVYDEGTWTPTLKIGSTTTSPTITHAKYTRIGDIMHLCAAIAFTRGAGETGAFVVGGLPVAASSSGTAVVGVTCGDAINATNVVGEIKVLSSNIALKVNSASTGGTQVAFSDSHVAASTATSIAFNGFYFV